HNKSRNIPTRRARVNHAVMVMTDRKTYLKNGPPATGSFDSFRPPTYREFILTSLSLRSSLTSPRMFPQNSSKSRYNLSKRRDLYVETPFLTYSLGCRCCGGLSAITRL